MINDDNLDKSLSCGAIAVFDSGIGGISVLSSAIKRLPQENFIYFADIAHAPYGEKTAEEVRRLMGNNCDYLLSKGIKALVIACNTATSAAAWQLRDKLSIPVLGVEPAVKPAVAENCGKIAVLATSLTIKEEKFSHLLAELVADQQIIPLACPGLMELAEQDPFSAAARDYLENLLRPYADEIDAVVLGCTHYVFFRPLLAELFPYLQVYDGNQGVSRHLEKVLLDNCLTGGEGRLVWDCSFEHGQQRDDFIAKCQRYFQYARRIDNNIY